MDRLIGYLSPSLALARSAPAGVVQRNYQAATPSHLRSTPRARGSGNAVMEHARNKLADWGTHLDENHDLTAGALNILSQMVGSQKLIPMLRRRNGQHLEDQSQQLESAWMRWGAQADRSGCDHFERLQRLMARAYFRDGEVFAVHSLGGDGHGGPVPYSFRAYESEWVPFDRLLPSPDDDGRRVLHGITIDADGRKLGYDFLGSHPADFVDGWAGDDLTYVTADRVTHMRHATRLGTYRGSSVLAPALTRLADVYDYEQNEQIAAKVASAVCLQITRDPSFAVDDDVIASLAGITNAFEAEAGMVFDRLRPGERIEVIDTSRPNPELVTYRQAMLRAASAGIGVSYSSMTHDYSGSYSSQRQDLVESRQAYRVHQSDWQHGVLAPIYRRFVTALLLMPSSESGVSFTSVDPRTLFEFDLVPPEVPWIQPLQEAKADTERLQNETESPQGVMRARNVNPRRVERERASFVSTVSTITAPGAAENEELEDETEAE